MCKDERFFHPFGCFCCSPSLALRVDASIPFRGYTPGQTINVAIDVNNESSKTVSNFYVDFIRVIYEHTLGGAKTYEPFELLLFQEITFYAHADLLCGRRSDQRVYEYILTGVKTDCSIRHDTIYVNLKVPATPPTDTLTSKVVHVEYVIRVNGTCHLNFVEIPCQIPDFFG